MKIVLLSGETVYPVRLQGHGDAYPPDRTGESFPCLRRSHPEKPIGPLQGSIDFFSSLSFCGPHQSCPVLPRMPFFLRRNLNFPLIVLHNAGALTGNEYSSISSYSAMSGCSSIRFSIFRSVSSSNRGFRPLFNGRASQLPVSRYNASRRVIALTLTCISFDIFLWLAPFSFARIILSRISFDNGAGISLTAFAPLYHVRFVLLMRNKNRHNSPPMEGWRRSRRGGFVFIYIVCLYIRLTCL